MCHQRRTPVHLTRPGQPPFAPAPGQPFPTCREMTVGVGPARDIRPPFRLEPRCQFARVVKVGPARKRGERGFASGSRVNACLDLLQAQQGFENSCHIHAMVRQVMPRAGFARDLAPRFAEITHVGPDQSSRMLRHYDRGCQGATIPDLVTLTRHVDDDRLRKSARVSGDWLPNGATAFRSSRTCQPIQQCGQK